METRDWEKKENETAGAEKNDALLKAEKEGSEVFEDPKREPEAPGKEENQPEKEKNQPEKEKHQPEGEAFRKAEPEERGRREKAGQKTPQARGIRNFVIVALVFAFIAGGIALFVPFGSDGQRYEPVSEEHIALLYVTGSIDETSSSADLYQSSYNQKWLLNTIESIKNSATNRGLMLYLDTPGGSVYATDQVYFKLLEYKEQTGRPIYVSMGPTAASGGYYMAMAADRIYANRNTLTGSIGVTLGTFYDVSGLLENLGITTTTLTSGANKAMGSSTQPMTQQQREIYQSIIDESYQQFLDVVQKGRGIDRESLLSIADGRVYTANQALSLGLIDGIATTEQALASMMSEQGLENAMVAEYRYQPSQPFWMKLLSTASRLSSESEEQGELAAVLKLIEENPTRPMYIMP